MDLLSTDPSALENIPAMPPPPGVTPNFVDPYSLAPAGRIAIGVTLPLMVIAVFSRLYTRLWVTHSIGADDCLCIAATASVIAYYAVALAIFGPSMGPHMWNVPVSEVTPRLIQGSTTVANLYSTGAMLLKLSLLILYRRIFRTNKTANFLIWIGMALIVLFYSICIITTSVFCRLNQWPSVMSAAEFIVLQSQSSCNRPQLNLEAGQGVFSTASDIYVLAIPINLVWSLQLPLHRRVGICAIFLVGLVATACSIATLYSRFNQRHSVDFAWDSSLNIILGGVELNVGVFCSCMPVSFIIFKQGFVSLRICITHIGHYLKTFHHGRSGSTTVEGSDSNLKLAANSSELQDRLPKVPRATITGLRTLLRGSRSAQTTGLTETSTYGDLRSLDEEYHAQLNNIRNTGSSPSQQASAVRHA